MQIETASTVHVPLPPVRMTVTGKIRTHAREGKGTLIGGWMDGKLIQPFTGVSVEVPQNPEM